ncbi:MAG: response regulator [Cyanobacteria bacterium SBLK]|nr:response regulator [Cyanobacteria bacterium SBLK]
MKTALVVEDSKTEQEFMNRTLTQMGWQVALVSDVDDARGKMASEKPDIICLDVILPGQSGFEFCRELKLNPETKNIPVIICSTKGTEVDRTWGTMLGADAYLAKPIDPEELKQTVNRLV